MKKPVSESVEVLRRAVAQAKEENRPLGILFVCLGNICRSPAAEGVMLSMAAEAGMSKDIKVDSAGFYGGHRGDLPDPRMRKAASARGLNLTHRSRTVKPSDFEDFDIIVGMDDNNIDSLHRAAPTVEDEAKIVRMSDFAVNHPHADSVPDPYWEGAEGFEIVLDLLEDSCKEMLGIIRRADNAE